MLRNRFGGIHVDVRKSASETLVTLSAFKRGLAPVQLINNTKDQVIRYAEKGTGSKGEVFFLLPGQSCYYTWLKPGGPRILTWLPEMHQNPTEDCYENSLETDGQGSIHLGQDKLGQDKYLSWVSFLDGMQRVLLFTDDANLCYELANTNGDGERIDLEIDISIFGIGLSLINNSLCQEIVYMNISSSDIIWEVRKQGKTRYLCTLC